MKKYIIILFSGILFYVLLDNFMSVLDVALFILSVIFPFILGSAIAFIISVPMRQVEKRLFRNTKFAILKRLRRIVALIITVTALLSIITLAMVVVIPQVSTTITDLAGKLPDALDETVDWLKVQSISYPEIEEFVNELDVDWHEIMDNIINFVKNGAGGWINSGISIVSNVVSKVTTFFIGLVFSIYVLFQKEKLSGQIKQILYAFLPSKKVEKIIYVGKVTSQTFSNFLSGQCLEATILGTMFFISMLIFRLPYALMIGIIIAITALIPIVGAFIGCFIGIILIAIDSPAKAVFFVILFLVLQQIEGNLIYPHVVGSSVGLPSIWVLVAVTVGGKLFGVMGMIVFIPICSVLYSLFREYIKDRLNKKKIPSELYERGE